jgi:hypothetical protein
MRVRIMRGLFGTAFLLISMACFAADFIPPGDMGETPLGYGGPAYAPAYGGPAYGGPVYGGPIYGGPRLWWTRVCWPIQRLEWA